MIALCLSLSAIFDTVGIIILKKITSQMTQLQQLAVWFNIFVYVFLIISGFLGIYACIVKKRSAASLFTSLVIAQFPFSVASGALCLYLLFNNTSSQPWDTDKCMAIAFDRFTRDLCQKTDLLKGLSIATLVVTWLVEIMTILMANVFLSQLREEAARLDMLDPKYDRDGYDC